jgi:predicted phosphodiesterase
MEIPSVKKQTIYRIFMGFYFLGISVFASSPALAQADEAQIQKGNANPYKVYDTTPVVLYGPFLLDTSETSSTIEWITDTPCQGRVEYGESKLDHNENPQKDGLIPVGTLHRIEITGLLPGHTYQYRVVSTRVIRIKPYYAPKGLPLESSTYSFTTLDRARPSISFSFITDTHEDVERIHALMRMIDWRTTDFLVHAGDGVDWLDSEYQLFNYWLGPLSEGLDHTKPLIYARGNHEMRGPYARSLGSYLSSPEERYYFTRDDGPVHLIVVDTGEDKPDNNNEYSGLVDQAPYREDEYTWLRDLPSADKRMSEAPFRVIVMHQPQWGWVDGKNDKWTKLANQEHVDLVIAGHLHKFVHIQPGQGDNHFPILVVGQDQVARVDATAKELKVTVTAGDGSVVDSFVVARSER